MTQANPIECTISLLPPQRRFLFSPARECLYSGAFGAGKSRALCIKLVMRASHPGAREGLFRKHLVTLKATTLRTLLEPDGDLPPVLPPGTYRQNKSERTIQIIGGGQIAYGGLDDPAKIASMTLSGAAVDEAVEVTEDDWTMLRGRIRMKLSGLPNALYGACNPGPPSHHLAKRFGLDGHSTPAKGCEAITTKSTDNWFLPADYLADLDTYSGVYRARYVDGLWVGAEGLVYDRWDRQVCVRHREGPWSRVIVGQDEGYTAPACLLLICQDAEGRIHIADEFYQTRQLETAIVDQADRWRDRYKPEAFVLDPSAAKLRAAMQKVSLNAVEANNDVFGGIQTVQKHIITDADGTPRFTVEPHCENTIREFETYEWAEGKDKPVKAHDHAMDALRYGIMHLGEYQELGVYVFGGEADDEEGWVGMRNRRFDPWSES